MKLRCHVRLSSTCACSALADTGLSSFGCFLGLCVTWCQPVKALTSVLTRTDPLHAVKLNMHKCIHVQSMGLPSQKSLQPRLCWTCRLSCYLCEVSRTARRFIENVLTYPHKYSRNLALHLVGFLWKSFDNSAPTIHLEIGLSIRIVMMNIV